MPCGPSSTAKCLVIASIPAFAAPACVYLLSSKQFSLLLLFQDITESAPVFLYLSTSISSDHSNQPLILTCSIIIIKLINSNLYDVFLQGNTASLKGGTDIDDIATSSLKAFQVNCLSNEECALEINVDDSSETIW